MENKVNLYKAIEAIRDKCGIVEKDGRNTHFNYDYATEISLSRAIRPLLKEQGLIIIPSADSFYIDSKNITHLMMEYTIVHVESCEWLTLKCLGSGQDPQDKGAYKANTGAFKYMLTRLFMIDTGDDPERDSESPPTKTERPKVPFSYPHPATRSSAKPSTGSGGGGFANEKQVKLLKGRSFSRAEKLMNDGHNQDGNKFEFGTEIRMKAYYTLGIANEDTIPKGAVNELIAMIDNATIDEDGIISVITDGEAPF